MSSHDSGATVTGDPKRIVEAGYDRVAHEYARLEGEAEWPRMRWLRRMLGRLEPGSSVLDLGCGSGDPADVEIARAHTVGLHHHRGSAYTSEDKRRRPC